MNPEGTHLVFKRYIHIGIAVDTPNGLVVPVIRDADKKSVKDIAVDMQTLNFQEHMQEKQIVGRDSISILGIYRDWLN